MPSYNVSSVSGAVAICVGAIVVLLIVIGLLADRYIKPMPRERQPARHSKTRREPGAHSSADAIRDRNTADWLYQARTIGLADRFGSDTVQMSSFDSREYMAAQERIALAHEHQLYVDADKIWAEDIRAIFADAARIEADLQSGRLAFPEWIWREHACSTHCQHSTPRLLPAL